MSRTVNALVISCAILFGALAICIQLTSLINLQSETNDLLWEQNEYMFYIPDEELDEPYPPVEMIIMDHRVPATGLPQ